MKKNVIKTVLTVVLLTAIICLSIGLSVYRAGACLPLMDDAALLAGRLSFINGDPYECTEEETDAPDESPRPLAEEAETPAEPTEHPKNTSHSGESYPIKETKITNGTMSYENISVRNTTGYEPDFEELLSSPLPFEMEDNSTVQVLIYHTHSCESYMDEDIGVYYEDYYPRSTDPEQSVIAAGEELAQALKAHGIGVVHDTTLHDYPSYEGSYARSWDTISAYREKYPHIKVTIDLHRDAMTAQDGTKYKPTFEYDGEKAAQIMIMAGYDTEGGFDFWDENLIFAAQLQKRCEDSYPGMTRPLNFGEFTYNMNFNNGSLLIEVGTDANTVEEACRSAGYLGEAMASVLS